MSGREFSGFDMNTLTEAVSPPPFDALRSTARSRRHRSVAMVAAALVALAGLAVLPLVARAGPGRAGGPRDNVGCAVQPVHADRARTPGSTSAGRLRRALRVHRRRRPQLVGLGRGALRGHQMCGRYRRRDAGQRHGLLRAR